MNETILLTFAVALVLVMQAGFLALESGLTRSKNNTNVALKNLIDLSITTSFFWIFGFALAFKTPLLNLDYNLFDEGFFFTTSSSKEYLFFIFQALFCATCSTIISGAVAERLRFKAYPIMVIVTSVFVYPVIANSIWSGKFIDGSIGWLYAKGFYDFAGSTVVHSTGGWMALGILIILGPRLGRFDKNGKLKVIPGSNLPLSALGCIALWFGWLGFNGGSVFSDIDSLGIVIMNTVVSGSFATTTAYITTFFLKDKTPHFEFYIFSALAGLVGVTASCNVVSPLSAAIIGVISSIVSTFVQRVLINFKLDDVTGAVAVHLAAGVWGTLAVAIFGNLELIDNGLSRLELLNVQFIGICATALWAFPISIILGLTLKKFNLLRVSKEDEIRGLNLSEHNEESEFNELLSFMLDPNLTFEKSNFNTEEEAYSEMNVIAIAFNRVLERLNIKEKELEQVNNSLQKSNKELKTYDHTVAHDLKNPVGVIRNYCDILLEKENDDLKKAYLNKIKKACNTSLEIIEGLLELAQEDTSDLTEIVNLKIVMDEILKDFDDLIKNHDAIIECNFESNYINANKLAIKQIFANIISNALKYGPNDKQPSIRISSHKFKDTTRIEFEDNGIGIKAEHYEKVFDKLARVNEESTSAEGHGIGLATVKNLVEKYQGTIEVSSIEKVGSIFTIYFPLVKVKKSEKEKLEKHTLKKNIVLNDSFRILAVDDDPSILDILDIYLKKHYSNITYANNGKEALEFVKENNGYDAILLDQTMPEMDGLATIKAIRSWEENENKNASPIIALTAASDQNLIISLFDAGCDTYIEKPINKNSILSSIKLLNDKKTKNAA
jgi:Amt family ammonium transporter